MFISNAYAAAGDAAATVEPVGFSGLMGPLLPLLLIFVVFYFMVLRPQNKRIIDPFLKSIIGIKEQHNHIPEPPFQLLETFGMQKGIAVVLRRLAQPDAGARHGDQIICFLQMHDFHLRIFAEHDGRHRIDGHGCQQPHTKRAGDHGR